MVNDSLDDAEDVTMLENIETKAHMQVIIKIVLIVKDKFVFNEKYFCNHIPRKEKKPE
jgi:hypothetical protein